MADQDDRFLDAYTMAVRGTSINVHGKAYVNGRAMGEERIAEVIECYTFLREAADGRDVPVSHVAKMAKVSWAVAKRVILEVDAGVGDSRSGWLLNRPIGVGSRVGLSYEQECYILWLRFSDPFWTNEDYVRELYSKFGLKVSRMFIS